MWLTNALGISGEPGLLPDKMTHSDLPAHSTCSSSPQGAAVIPLMTAGSCRIASAPLGTLLIDAEEKSGDGEGRRLSCLLVPALSRLRPWRRPSMQIAVAMSVSKSAGGSRAASSS